MSLHRIQRAPARDTTSKRDSLMREHERTLSRGLNGDSTNSPRALYRRFTYRRFTYRRFTYRRFTYRRLTYRRFILPSPYLPSEFRGLVGTRRGSLKLGVGTLRAEMLQQL